MSHSEWCLAREFSLTTVWQFSRLIIRADKESAGDLTRSYGRRSSQVLSGRLGTIRSVRTADTQTEVRVQLETSIHRDVDSGGLAGSVGASTSKVDLPSP